MNSRSLSRPVFNSRSKKSSLGKFVRFGAGPCFLMLISNIIIIMKNKKAKKQDST